MAKSLSLQEQLNMKSQVKEKLNEVRRHTELAMACLSPWGSHVPSAIDHTEGAASNLKDAKKTLTTLWRKTSYAGKAKKKRQG